MTTGEHQIYFITEGQLRNLIYARYEKEGGTEEEDDQIHELIKETLVKVRGNSVSAGAAGEAENVLEELEKAIDDMEGSVPFAPVEFNDGRELAYNYVRRKIVELRAQQKGEQG